MSRQPLIALVVIPIAACGRIAFDPRELDSDASGPMPDASEPPALEFGTPTPVTELNSASSEVHPSLRSDLLEIFFSSNRMPRLGMADFWTATRASPSDPWSAPVHLPELSSTLDEHAIVLFPDGLKVHLTRLGNPSVEVYEATRAAVGAPWSTPVLVDMGVGIGGITPDGLTMVVDSATISIRTRASTTEPFGPHTSLGPQFAGNDPWIDGSGRAVLFADNRAGGNGANDIWAARRATSADAFGQPFNLGSAGINTAAVETTPWLSQDGQVLVFSRAGELMFARAP